MQYVTSGSVSAQLTPPHLSQTTCQSGQESVPKTPCYCIKTIPQNSACVSWVCMTDIYAPPLAFMLASQRIPQRHCAWAKCCWWLSLSTAVCKVGKNHTHAHMHTRAHTHAQIKNSQLAQMAVKNIFGAVSFEDTVMHTTQETLNTPRSVISN